MITFTSLKDIKKIEALNIIEFDIDEEIIKDDIINIYNSKFNQTLDQNPLILYHIGLYYQYIKKDYDQMKKYYFHLLQLSGICINYPAKKLCIDNKNKILDVITRLGDYYKEVEEDYVKMKKYYLIPIEKGNSNAMCSLANYYKYIGEDYKLMKKYYLMAIKKDNSNAMCGFGDYYKDVEINYELMKKYYLMAIKKGNYIAMNNLGVYYDQIGDYDEMKKYYLMAIDNGNTGTYYNLGLYYEEVEKDYQQMKKYYLMAIEEGDSDAMYNLGLYYEEVEKNYVQMVKYYQIAIENGNDEAQEKLDNYNSNMVINDSIKKKKTDKISECIVCYETRIMYATSCNNHFICGDCIIELFNKPCPICRG